MSIFCNRILIIGGTGSLGYAIARRCLGNNTIYVYSRDESKHWKMSLDFKKYTDQINPRCGSNLNFVIGDIRDSSKVSQTLFRVNPHIVIIASAMKHIDRCEYETNECILTNITGTQNVLNAVEMYRDRLTNLNTVVFISTDKACSPTNVYGCCKSLSELLMVEKSKSIHDIKFVNVRYGNVLNSRGSIIPILKDLGEKSEVESYTLTDERMTRYLMTLEESVNLIMYAITDCASGDTVIPKIRSCYIKDLIEIYAERYNKTVRITGLRPGEKLHESIISETQSIRTVDRGKYFLIKPVYSEIKGDIEVKDYNSSSTDIIIGKDELKEYLQMLNLL